MNALSLHEFHAGLNAHFTQVNGAEAVAHYGDFLVEHAALRETAGVIDLSFRGRICLTGADRIRFLHGQITNDVKKLRVGEGCYAALVTAKGKMESDLNIFCLQDELLLDFEPGLTEKISQRLEKYVVADDVQIVAVTAHYGLLSVQGPKAGAAIRNVGLFSKLPEKEYHIQKISDATLGEIYLMNHLRLAESAGVSLASLGDEIEPRRRDGSAPRRGFDLFVPTNSLAAVADKLIAAAKSVGGRACGWQAFNVARIEAGIPLFGVDMDETNIPIECGIESRAISYNKGCYIGQEVINRIHTIGRVTKELRSLHLADGLKTLPAKGDKLFHDGKEAGYITSAVASPALKANLALGYVRREASQPGTELILRNNHGEIRAKIALS